MKKARVIDEGIIFTGEKNTDHQSCTFPGICVLPDGRWISSCRAAPLKKENASQHILLSFSDDEGDTWSKPYRPFKPLSVKGKPGLFRTGYITSIDKNEIIAVLSWVDNSNPSLPLFNEETEGLLDCKIFTSRSLDRGLTWSQPSRVELPAFFDVPTPTTGPILNLSKNELICQFETNKKYYDTTEWHHSSVLIFSKDRGLSWPQYVVVSKDPENRIFYWDQRPGLLGNKYILDLFWTYDNLKGKYLNIHARESRDNGKTWSAIWDTGVPGQPATPVALSDGRIAMVFVDRTGVPSIKMRLSEDGGKTWPLETETIIYASKEAQTWKKKSMQDAWAEMTAFSVGLPATAILPNDDIIVVYYAGDSTDNTDIKWTRLRL